ncbi:hypothetical protein FRC11_003588, partial [Ceratobasidium sp. 423]
MLTFSDFYGQVERVFTYVRNVVIGANQAEGIHCLGPCNLYNVWFEDVCEDAITIKQTSGQSDIIGGGAKNADDKVVHN